MNFLLGTLLIILFLFPGFIFRASYLNVRHGRSFRALFVEELLFSIVPTILIHSIIIPFTILFFDFSTDGFYLLMINSSAAIDWINTWDIMRLLAYCGATYILGYLFGVWFRRFVEWRNWEINIPLFRIRNEWYYVLAGFIFQVTRKSGKSWNLFATADEIRIDVVVELGKEAYIYRGKLSGFVLSKEDGLDRLFLSDVTRRPFDPQIRENETSTKPQKRVSTFDEFIKSDEKEGKNKVILDMKEDITKKPIEKDSEYYSVPGNTIIIPFKEIRNLNIKYIFIDQQ